MQIKILVFSDSHGATFNMERIISQNPDAECVFFLGDGLSTAKHIAMPVTTGFLYVPGNCDYDSKDPADVITEMGGYRFLLTHGSRYGVNDGTVALELAAIKNNCDIALFGHTHKTFYNKIERDGKTLHLFNPGSVSQPRGEAASYGIIKISDNGIEFQHKRV